MRKDIIMGIVLAAALILCMGCQTYQLGISYEPRENSHVIGGTFGGDVGSYVENSISYIHTMYPDTNGLGAHGIGYDFNFKYPFHFAQNYISVFPMVGLESRFIFTTSKYKEDNLFPPPDKNKQWGVGVKVGGGFDISFFSVFYLRGAVFYQPEMTTLANSYPGFRFNAALGYRAW